MANLRVMMKTFLVAVLFLSAVFCQEKKVEEFQLQISEDGTKFEETIEVDTEAQTEVYKVPAHNKIGKAEVMNDFKRRLTVYRIHDVKTCYVSRLQPDEPSPRVLKESLKKVSSSNKGLPVTLVSRHWIPKELFPVYLLSKETLKFCGDYPVYRVEQHSIDALLSVKNAQGGQHQRTKRKVIFCKPYLSYNLGCESQDWLLSCKVTSTTCLYRVTCVPDPEKELCSDHHLYNRFICCDPFCK